jgi:hypothetical protein
MLKGDYKRHERYLFSVSSELLTYPKKSFQYSSLGGCGCEPKTVRFLRLQREVHDLGFYEI